MPGRVRGSARFWSCDGSKEKAEAKVFIGIGKQFIII